MRRARAPQLLAALLACGLGTLARAAGAADAPAAAPPRFEVPAHVPFSFVVYGDTRFTSRKDVVNAAARRALVEGIARENPAAIFIGGDLVFEGSNRDDYAVFKSETAPWSARGIPVFPALGNHEFGGCNDERRNDEADGPCLENWWNAFSALPLRPHRWYSVAIGSTLLALVIDSDSALLPGSAQRVWFERQMTQAGPDVRFMLVLLHHPPVRDPFYPRSRDEQEIERYLAHNAAALRAQVVVVGSHVHNYERYQRDGVMYLVSGGGGARPVPAPRLFGELSRLRTAVNFHYLRFTVDEERLTGTMVRFDADDRAGSPWSEPDRFEIRARSP